MDAQEFLKICEEVGTSNLIVRHKKSGKFYVVHEDCAKAVEGEEHNFVYDGNVRVMRRGGYKIKTQWFDLKHVTYVRPLAKGESPNITWELNK